MPCLVRTWVLAPLKIFARFSATVFSLSACLLILGAAVVGLGEEKRTLPNIVLIFADDLGVNDLACYGRKEHNTPNSPLPPVSRVGFVFAGGETTTLNPCSCGPNPAPPKCHLPNKPVA